MDFEGTKNIIGYCTRLTFLVHHAMRTGISAYIEDETDSLDTLDRTCEFCPSRKQELPMWVQIED